MHFVTFVVSGVQCPVTRDSISFEAVFQILRFVTWPGTKSSMVLEHSEIKIIFSPHAIVRLRNVGHACAN